MGRPIVYCGICGRSLKEDDFSKGKAHLVDNAPYCTDCRIVPEPIAPPPRPGANPPTPRPAPTPVIPKPSGVSSRSLPSGTPRRGEPAVQDESNSIAVVVGIGVAVLAILILVAIALSGRDPMPTPERTPAPATLHHRGPEQGRAPAPVGNDEKTLASIRDLEAFASTSTDPDAVMERCREARPLLRGTSFAGRLEAVEARATEALNARSRDRQLTASIDGVQKLRELDPQFQRRSEVESMLRTALDISGPRRSEVEKVLEEYRKAADAYKSKPPDPPAAAKVLYAENFNQGAGGWVKGEIVPGGVDGTKALSIAKTGTYLETRFRQPAGPTWTIRFKAKPSAAMNGLEFIIWAGNGRGNFRYHLRGLPKNEWTTVEIKAAQLHKEWNGKGPMFEGEMADTVTFYYDDALPDGAVLIDNFEVTE